MEARRAVGRDAELGRARGFRNGGSEEPVPDDENLAVICIGEALVEGMVKAMEKKPAPFLMLSTRSASPSPTQNSSVTAPAVNTPVLTSVWST